MKESPPTARPRTEKPRRRKRRWTFAIGIALIVGAVVLFLPNLAVTFFPQRILAIASSQINGRISAGSISCGWWQPIVLDKVVATDAKNQPVLEANQVRIDKTLLSFITSSSNIGVVHVDQPHVHVQTWKSGSNIEELLAPILSKPKTNEPLAVAWDVKQGEVEFASPNNGGNPVVWRIASLTGNFQRGSQTSVSVLSDIEFAAGADTGRWKMEAAQSADQKGEVNTGTNVEFVADHLPLQAFAPVIARFAEHVDITGELNGRGHVVWNPVDKKGQVDQLNVDVRSLRIDAPDVLRGAPLAMRAIALQGAARWDQHEVNLEGLTVTSDFATLRFDGTAKVPSNVGGLALAQELLAKSSLQVDARTDLAALAAAMPGVLRLRDDVEIRSGEVVMKLTSEPGPNETRWNATLQTSDLEAVRGTSRYVWKDPLNGTLAARWTPTGLVVDELQCSSKFLKATLEGQPQNGAVLVNADLRLLVQELAQFVDLRNMTAQGQLTSRTQWKRAANRIDLDGFVTLDDFTWTVPGKAPWQEPHLNLAYVASLDRDPTGAVIGIDKASCELTAPAERVLLKLKEPVRAPIARATWPIDLLVSSRLEKWEPRLRPLVNLNDLRLGGILEMKGDATVSEQTVSLNNMQADLEEFQLQTKTVQIVEPRVVVQAAGQWSRQASTWTTSHAQFQSSAFALGTDDLAVQLSDAPRINGELQYSGDLAALQNWLVTTSRPYELRGELVGSTKFNSENDSIEADWQVDVSQFEVTALRAPSPSVQPVSTSFIRKTLWRDPKISLAAQSNWLSSKERLDVSRLDVKAEGIQILAKGSLAELTNRMLVDLDGELQYDLEALGDKIRELSIKELALTGERREPFSLRGPLRHPTLAASPNQIAATNQTIVPRELVGQASFGWNSADIMGVKIGEGQLRGELKNARVQFSALDIPVSSGRFTAAPFIDLTTPPARFELPPGPLMTDVEITPEMCRSWMRFVAPMVANATSTNGTFSVQLDRLSMPLGDANHGEAAGALIIKVAKVGPGPMSKVVLSIVDQFGSLLDKRLPALSEQERWIYLPAQVVAFEVKDGRVVHREFQMCAGNVQVVTNGWVAFDQTMALNLEIPVPDEFADRSRLLAGLRGQKIAVGVTGTLDQPRFDKNIFSNLGQQAIGSAAGGLLKDLFERRMQKEKK